MEKNKRNFSENEFNDQVEGRNAVLELLESGRDINKIYVSEGEKHGSINRIIAIARERKIIINEISKVKLNQMAQTENNQGNGSRSVLQASAYPYRQHSRRIPR